MELIRDYLLFTCQRSGNKLGYSLNDVNMDTGPIFNFFGYDIVGVTLENKKLSIEFDKDVNPLGFGLSINNKPKQPIAPFEEVSFEVSQVVSEIPFDRVQIYKITDGVLELIHLKSDQFSSATYKTIVQPIFDRGVRSNDLFYVKDSDNFYQRLEIPFGSKSDFIEGERYIVAFKPIDEILREQHGVTTASTVAVTDEFLIKDMKTSIRTTTAYIGKGNEVKVKVSHKGKGLSVLNFDRYKLYGATEIALDTDIDDFLKYGESQGEFVLNLGDVIQEPGVYKTALVGYNSSRPEGVIIWHPDVVKSRLNITMVAT